MVEEKRDKSNKPKDIAKGTVSSEDIIIKRKMQGDQIVSSEDIHREKKAQTKSK